MKTILVLLSCILLGLISINAQTIRHRFIATNSWDWTDTSTNKSIKQLFDLTSCRSYLTDSSLIDTRIFCDSDTLACAIRFKKTQSTWRIQLSDSFILFYPNMESIRFYDTLRADSATLSFMDTRVFQGQICYSFIIMYDDIQQGDQSVFWFSPTEGIVALGGGQMTLVRRDLLLRGASN